MLRIVLVVLSSLAFTAIFVDRLITGDFDGVRTSFYVFIVVLSQILREIMAIRAQKTIVIHRSPTEEEWHAFMRAHTSRYIEDKRE